MTNLIRQLVGRSDRSIWDDQDFSASRRALRVRQGSADFIDGVDGSNWSPQSACVHLSGYIGIECADFR